MTNPVANQWVSIPSGSFARGDSNIHVSAFQIQKHEVTRGEYQKFLALQKGRPFKAVMRCGQENPVNVVAFQRDKFLASYFKLHDACAPDKSFVIASVESYPAELQDYGNKFRDDNQPAVGVDWFSAKAYCESLGGDLPTETQWKHAARGQTGGDFNVTGEQWVHYGWSKQSPAPVCSYPLNSFGLCDVFGNVWEWTLDWYRKAMDETPGQQDPKGPPNGLYKVMRGGSWLVDDASDEDLGLADRYPQHPGFRNNDVGFRCARNSSD